MVVFIMMIVKYVEITGRIITKCKDKKELFIELPNKHTVQCKNVVNIDKYKINDKVKVKGKGIIIIDNIIRIVDSDIEIL